MKAEKEYYEKFIRTNKIKILNNLQILRIFYDELFANIGFINNIGKDDKLNKLYALDIIARAIIKLMNSIQPEYIIITKSRAITIIKNQEILASILVQYPRSNPLDLDDKLFSPYMNYIIDYIDKRYIREQIYKSNFDKLKYLMKDIISKFICIPNYLINCNNAICEYKLHIKGSKSLCEIITNLVMDKFKFMNWGIHKIIQILSKQKYDITKVFNKYDLSEYIKPNEYTSSEIISPSICEFSLIDLIDSIGVYVRNNFKTYIFDPHLKSNPNLQNIITKLVISIIPSTRWKSVYVNILMNIYDNISVEVRIPLISPVYVKYFH